MKRKSSVIKLQTDIVGTIRIDHAQFTRVATALTNAWADVGTTATPVCLLVIGDTRTGKSCVISDFLAAHQAARTKENGIQTVIYAVAPPKATVKALLEQLLKGLGDPNWHRGTQTNMTGRLYKMLEEVSCKLIVIDEFQHLSDKGQDKKLLETSDFLKNLIECKTWGLVAVGLPSSQAVINANPQLRARFDAPLSMPTFDWRDAGLRRQFKAILIAFRKQLSHFDLPEFASEEIALRMCMASCGRIGLVAKLLDRAVKNAIRSSTRTIRMADLQSAFDEAIWYAPNFPLAGGPFEAEIEVLVNFGVVGEVFDLACNDTYADATGSVKIVSSRSRSSPDATRHAPVTKRQHLNEISVAL